MAFGPITSWEIDEETMETMTDFIFLGSKITADGDCSHEIRRPGFDPCVGKIPWRRPRQPTPVFLPEESPWIEVPDGLQSMGSQRVRHD